MKIFGSSSKMKQISNPEKPYYIYARANFTDIPVWHTFEKSFGLVTSSLPDKVCFSMNTWRMADGIFLSDISSTSFEDQLYAR